LARRHAHVTFVADASGFADMWFEVIGVMEAHANVVLCASMIWGKGIGNAINRVGAERVMFGSGEPRDSLAAALRRIERLELADEVRRAVMAENARRVFGLTEGHGRAGHAAR
jgi:predicted TIM-barrel fold metal-dependent hydrolase